MRFGVLGDAKIAREQVVPAIRATGHEVTHLGRRSPGGTLDPLWGNVTVTDYDGVLHAEDVDAVYIPLPNHLHTPMAIRALDAGKPVLCEKPVALSLAELDAMEAAAQRSGLYLYDAYMVRHHPQWHWIRNLDIGTPTHIHAQFSYPPRPAGNVRNFADMGGGPIWDIGCYCLLSGLMLFDGTPELVAIRKEAETDLDVEKSASAIVDFGAGQMLNMTVSSGTSLNQALRVIGTDGWAQLDVPFNPAAETTARSAHIDQGQKSLLGLGNEVRFASCNQYQLMIEDFAVAVAENRATDLSQSRHITRILQAMIDAV